MLRKLFQMLAMTAAASSFAAQECKIEPQAVFPKLPHMMLPLAMVQPKSDSSFWLVALREGELLAFKNDPDVEVHKKVLDIKYKVSTEVEMGLTGVVFHPDYPKDQRIFITYNDSSKENQSTLASFTLDPQSHFIDPASEKVILTLPQDTGPFHNGGHVVFGPDNMLYVGFGDGGYTPPYAQETDNFYGTIIRIDVSSEPYKVPADNPFNKGQALCQNGKGKKDCPEVYAYGFRNPWRFSFDPADNRLWAGDVGEDDFEEINIVEPKKNYGWDTMEGTQCFSAWLPWLCLSWGMTDPINGYDIESGGQSIIGGYVYRGKQIKQLQGKYVFGDVYAQKTYSLDANAAPMSPIQDLFDTGFMAVSFAQDNDGELYMLNFGGAKEGEGVYKIVENCQ